MLKRDEARKRQDKEITSTLEEVKYCIRSLKNKYLPGSGQSMKEKYSKSYVKHIRNGLEINLGKTEYLTTKPEHIANLEIEEIKRGRSLDNEQTI